MKTARLLTSLKTWARRIKHDVLTLSVAARDARTPWYAKVTCALIAAYALSPIDLIPDFIPVVGYLDELILLPLAIQLAVRLVPNELMAEFRTEAERRAERPVSRLGFLLVVAVWIGVAILIARALWPEIPA